MTWGLDKVEKYITEIANGLFADMETKEKARNNLLHVVVLSCIQYQNDPKFKQEMDSLMLFLQTK